MRQETPALCPAPGLLGHVPLGQLPSLHLLRRSHGPTLVRRLRRYYEAVPLPAPVHHGRAPRVHRADLARPHQARCRASRVPHTVFSRMPEVSDPARCGDALPSRRPRCCLPRVRSASAPRSSPISGLNTLPARSPVNASPPTVTDSHRMTRGQCGWLDPSLSGNFTLQHSAGFSRALTRTLGVRRGGKAGAPSGRWKASPARLDWALAPSR